MTDKDGIKNFDKFREEFRRERRHGDTHKAYLALQKMLSFPHAELRDFFAAGECALRLHLFSDAVGYLSKTITLSQESNYIYFLDQAYFWRAYALFKLERYGLAASDIDLIKHIDIPFYVYSFTPQKEVFAFTADELADMIKDATDSNGTSA